MVKVKMSTEKSEKITIELIDENERETVADVLRESFYKDNPLNLSYDAEDFNERDEFCVKNLVEMCSFKALNAKGEIVALALNRILKKESHEQPPANAHPNIQKILNLLSFVGQQFDAFEEYPEETAYLVLRILTTKPEYRSLGIATKLIEQTIEYMRTNQLKLISILCTSYYSAKICEKLQFDKVYCLPYADYKVDDEIVFQPPKPHDAVRLYVKKIQ